MVGGIKEIIISARRHLIPVGLIILLATLLFHLNFLSAGMLLYIDMTWPLSTARTLEIYLSVWHPYGSWPNFESIQRLPWVLLLLYPAVLIGIPIETYLLLLFVGTFALSGVSMYFLAVFLLTKHHPSGWIVSSAALVAAVVYMYNPWSLGHLWTYFQFPSYALLPLIFIFVVKTFGDFSAKHIIILASLATLASTHPWGVIWIASLVLAYAIYHLFGNFRNISFSLK